MTNLSEALNFKYAFNDQLNIHELIGDRDFAKQYWAKERSLANLDIPTNQLSTFSRVVQEDAPLFLIAPPVRQQPQINRFIKEQEYEGIVVAVNLSEGLFTARLVDLTSGGPDEEGEFALSELNGDQYLVVPGALFTWTIGLQWRGLTQLRVSDIRFRRLPSFSTEAILNAEEEAFELARLLIEQDAQQAFSPRAR